MRYIVVLLFIFSLKAVGQQCELNFYPVFGNDPLSLETYYKINTTDSVQITALRFYISNIELLDQNKTVWKENNSYHLVDVSNVRSLNLMLNNTGKIKYNRIKFNIGIDSITNVSGALGGDLDPTKGMYWTWQSGYINFKLEGNSNLCKSRNNEFQFHLGGYIHPYNNVQAIFTDMPGQHIDMVIDIKQLIKDIDLTKQHHIMSPCKEAMELSEVMVQSLNVKREK